jgi:hypothetical protein
VIAVANGASGEMTAHGRSGTGRDDGVAHSALTTAQASHRPDEDDHRGVSRTCRGLDVARISAREVSCLVRSKARLIRYCSVPWVMRSSGMPAEFAVLIPGQRKTPVKSDCDVRRGFELDGGLHRGRHCVRSVCRRCRRTWAARSWTARR